MGKKGVKINGNLFKRISEICKRIPQFRCYLFMYLKQSYFINIKLSIVKNSLSKKERLKKI